MPVLDSLFVPDLAPTAKHPTVFKKFNDWKKVESFLLVNDHDPIPLYYEFRSVYGDVVGWQYLNRGGREWKVKVTRTEASKGREFTDISTLMDLRKAANFYRKEMPLRPWMQIRQIIIQPFPRTIFLIRGFCAICEKILLTDYADLHR